MEEDQPNFQSMGAAYTTLATECPKIPNALRIERFEARIVAAVTEQIDRLREEMREGFNRCEKSIATLDKNTQARLMNSQLWRSPGSRLQPLHNTATFEPIADFPATIDAANRLSGAAVTRLLAQLGIVVDASQTVAEKRRAFKRAIGVLSEISSNY
ncbi:hypothetical protein SLS57_010544 [Botryosphaeria dothidea]